MPSRELQPPAEVAPDGTGVHHNSGTLKKHKHLPHPRRNGSGDYSASTTTSSNISSNPTSASASRGLRLETDITSPSSINASQRTLKHASKRIIGSIDLPPTPPAHSRNSSNDASAGSLPIAPVTNGDIVESPACSTPVNVQSPPTPDFTPPRPRRVEAIQGLGKLPKEGAVRREMGSRNDSMNTTTSFVTAKEELDEETDGSTIRPQNSSPIDGMDYTPDDDRSDEREQGPPKMKSLGLGLHGLEDPLARHKTPTKDGTPLRKKFSFEDGFDGDFTPERGNGGVKEVENPILSRNVTITRGKPRRKPYNFDDTPTKQPGQEHRRRHSQPQGPQVRQEVVEDRLLGTPNAIRHLKEHGIEEGGSDFVRPTPRHSRQDDEMARTHRRSHTQPERISPLPQARQDHVHHSTDPAQDARKFSNGSHRSSSTVEAVVMIPPQQLKMRRTLRHKERMGSLRDFSPSQASGLRHMNGEVREPAQRLRHRSVDLPMRNMEDGRNQERPRMDEARIHEKRRTTSGRPPPEKQRDVPDHEAALPRSRQVSEATIIPARSRQVSEQTVIEHPQEHPRRSPLPEPPREEVVLTQPLVATEPARPAVQTTQPQTSQPQTSQPQSQPVSRPPQAIATQAETPKRRYSIERKPVPIRAPRPSISSVTTTSTIQTIDSAKSKSRKALLADGIIPVVIVPRRTSSLKEQSQPPSLRSTSASRQASNKGSRSSSTAPLSASAGSNIPGAWPSWTETPLGIGKRRNSDGSVGSGKVTPKEDGLVRSIDFGPPAIPVRRSSMSAPTTPMGSRNVSRSNSLTADSLRRHNEDQALAALSSHAESQREPGPSTRTVSQTIQQRRDENRDSGVGYGVGILSHGQTVRIEDPDETERHRSTHSSVDINGDPLFGQRLSAQVTPFSARSDVTGASHGTALEVAEARQVEVFSLKNGGVQLVDQEAPSSSASESIKLRNKSMARQGGSGRPTTSSSTATAMRPKLQAGEKYSSTSLVNPNSISNFTIANSTNARYPSSTVNIVPASPPQSANTFDSPLINPRQPPEVPAGPPAFKIIPPTPADLLAMEEEKKQLGWEPPRDGNGEVSRPPRRNWSVKLSGLARSLSLGRRNRERRGGMRTDDVDVGPSLSAPLDDERPAEEGKLHPFWKPSNYRDEEEECDCEECREYYAQVEEVARQQKTQRPGMPRRTTSQLSTISKKMKKTFAILPIAGVETTQDKRRDDGYNVSYATARRTIKRSGSGNLKVVKRVGNVSKESLKLQEYLNLSSRRQRSFRRLKLKGSKAKEGVSSGDRPQTPEQKQERKRFSWVGGSTDSPAGKYPPAVRYPPPSLSGTYESGPLKRAFSLPTRRNRDPTGTSFPPRVQVEWLGLGNLGRRLSGRRNSVDGERRREGLKRTISAPRGVMDGVEDVLTQRQRQEARRMKQGREEGVQREDFAR